MQTEPLRETGFPSDLASEKERTALTGAFFHLTEHWDLSRKEEAALLGWDYPAMRSRLDSMRKGKTILDRDRDKWERVVDLLNIHKSLRILFPHPSSRRQVYDWIHVKRERFGGSSALEIMLQEGKRGVSAIRRYLDFERMR